MYSIQGDLILDPFLGTGTTLIAALSSYRNCIGYEIDQEFRELIAQRLQSAIEFVNNYVINRINRHLEFIKGAENQNKFLKYQSEKYDFKVKTAYETKIDFKFVKEITKIDDNNYEALYFGEDFTDNLMNQLKNGNKLELNFVKARGKKLKFSVQQKLTP